MNQGICIPPRQDALNFGDITKVIEGSYRNLFLSQRTDSGKKINQRYCSTRSQEKAIIMSKGKYIYGCNHWIVYLKCLEKTSVVIWCYMNKN